MLQLIAFEQSKAELRCQDLFRSEKGATGPRPLVDLDQAIQEIVRLKFEMEGTDPSSSLRPRLERLFREAVTLYRDAYPADFQTHFELALKKGTDPNATDLIERRDEQIRREQDAALYSFTRERVHDLDRKVIGVVAKDLLLVEAQTHAALYDLKNRMEVAKLKKPAEKSRHLTISEDRKQIALLVPGRLGLVGLHLPAKTKFAKIRWYSLPADVTPTAISSLTVLGQGQPIVIGMANDLKIFIAEQGKLNLVGQLARQEKTAKPGLHLIANQWLVVEGSKETPFLFDLKAKKWLDVPSLGNELWGRLLHATPGQEQSELLLHFETGLVVTYDLATTAVDYPLGAERFMFDGGMITAGDGRYLVLYGNPGPFWTQPVRIYDRMRNIWLENPFPSRFVRPRHFRIDGSGRHLLFSDIHFRDAGDPLEAYLYRLDLQSLTGETFNLDPSRYPVSEVVNFDGTSILFYFDRQWIEIF